MYIYVVYQMRIAVQNWCWDGMGLGGMQCQLVLTLENRWPPPLVVFAFAILMERQGSHFLCNCKYINLLFILIGLGGGGGGAVAGLTDYLLM